MLLIRYALLGIAVSLAAFGLVRQIAAAYPVVLVVGFTYFVTITSLSTALQSHIADEVRGRVMALWIMGFGGTVPIGLIVGGAVATATSVSAVVVGGAAAAMVIGGVAWVRAPEAEVAGGGAA